MTPGQPSGSQPLLPGESRLRDGAQGAGQRSTPCPRRDPGQEAGPSSLNGLCWGRRGVLTVRVRGFAFRALLRKEPGLGASQTDSPTHAVPTIPTAYNPLSRLVLTCDELRACDMGRPTSRDAPPSAVPESSDSTFEMLSPASREESLGPWVSQGPPGALGPQRGWVGRGGALGLSRRPARARDGERLWGWGLPGRSWKCSTGH